MYFGMLLVTFGTSVTLGSLYALIPALAIAALTTARLLSEERLLIQGLPGYRAYCGWVRYWLVPGIC